MQDPKGMLDWDELRSTPARPTDKMDAATDPAAAHSGAAEPGAATDPDAAHSGAAEPGAAAAGHDLPGSAAAFSSARFGNGSTFDAAKTPLSPGGPGVTPGGPGSPGGSGGFAPAGNADNVGATAIAGHDPTPGYPALYYDGSSAKAWPVRFAALPEHMLRIYATAEHIRHVDWPKNEITPTGAMHDFPLQLRRKQDTGERLNIEDPAARHFMDEWLSPSLKQRRARKIRNWILAVGSVWALITMIWLNMDAVLSAAVSVIPEAWEHELGQTSKEQIARLLTFTPTGEIPWCAAPQGTAALARLAARLHMPMTSDPDAAPGQSASLPPGEDRPVEIAVLDSKIINAFALPGRHIVVTSAMLGAADSPEQLAGVLAHEMGHVTERHSTKRVLRAYGLGLIFQLIAGQGELFNALGGLGNTLAQNKFSRADETLADRLGVERMLKANLDPVPLAELFEKIRDQESQDPSNASPAQLWEYLSDHPDFDSRIAAIKALAAARQPQGATPHTPALTPEDWTTLQNICAEE